MSKAATSHLRGFSRAADRYLQSSSRSPGARQHCGASQDYDHPEAAASQQPEADDLSERIRPRSPNYYGSEAAKRTGWDNSGSQPPHPFPPNTPHAPPTET